MKFAIDAWQTEYGTAMSGVDLEAPSQPADISVEVDPDKWAPQDPPASTIEPETVLFSDGVRRVEARVWIQDDEGHTRPGICASYAAGLVRCDGRAMLETVEVRRGLFTAAPNAEPIQCVHGDFPVRSVMGDDPEQLSLGLQQRMGELEIELAVKSEPADLLIVDGPLSGRQTVLHAVGYVKTHRVMYLPSVVEQVVGALKPGQRTPLFLTTTSWSRYSWYLRLPGADGHAWAGIVRCEINADQPVAKAIEVADRVSLYLPRFASEAHKDPRAPQNLYPIGGLETVLRHRLGDCDLIYRSLRSVAAA